VKLNEIVRHSYNVFLSLNGQDWHVDSVTQLGEGVQPQITPEELIACEDILRADPQVVKLAAEVGQSLCLWSTIHY
jgi:primary-amine oxidase